jgi:hypothetical protein
MQVEIEGSTADYITWIRLDSSSGGFIELVAWADLFNVRIHLFSSTVFAEQLHEEKLNWRAVNSENEPAQTFHLYHSVGRGGVGGHYQLLQPILSPPPEIVHVAGGSPSCAPAAVPALCADGPLPSPAFCAAAASDTSSSSVSS